ncbi:MAG: SDR family NAD(P)-dependent oxidoreductase [Halioglobus sp.]|nr:SDR family NAD(P)-dependent oxidoreductase [Halioglobus sp.]
MEIAGKIAVVTGASSGIGRATALALAEAGATVVATARRERRLVELERELRVHTSGSCHIVGDIGERDFAEGLVRDTIERFGRIDILVNNAGVPKHEPLYDISADDAEALMRVNFLSCLWTTFAAIPHMLVQSQEGDAGCIVNVSSFAATVTPTFETVYAASKGAMNGFTRGLWNDLAGSGIHAVLVIPGPIDTEIWDKVHDDGAYAGAKYPARLVADEIVAAIREERFEVTVPKRNLQLVSARLFATFFPAVIRKGVARMNPVDPAIVKSAIARAREGLPMGRGRV